MEHQVERESWGSQLDFVLSCVGFAVGLGNVWRFPYLAYRNGGATFLIPYVIMLAIAGLPLFYIELALGQFASQGPLTVWNMSPAFAGIGYAMLIISGVVCIYYNVIIAYSIYYMLVSFVHLDNDLPWARCERTTWATDRCRDIPYPQFADMNESQAMFHITSDVYNSTCLSERLQDSNFTLALTSTYLVRVSNVTDLNSTMVFNNFSNCKKTFVSPADDYLSRYVLRLHEAESFSDLGGISLKLILTLALAWLLIFACLMKGIKSTGKVVYFTALFPYVILVVLLARGVTLEGHMKGIEYYVIPQWHKLMEPKAWGDAATQIFYSLGVGFGGLLTMASYSKFRNNCYRDAVLVAVINCSTSVFAGFAIFSLLGHMAHVTNQAVDKVAADGPSLAFIAYPEGITKLPAQSLFAFLFFFMLLTLGLDSQFAMMETVISGITDLFPHRLRHRKTILTFVSCLVGFLLGIPQTTKGGMWMLTLIDWYSGSFNLMFVALAEIVCLMYVYGFRNFCLDIEMMIGHQPNYYWKVMWVGVTPVAVSFIIVMSAVRWTPAGYRGYVFEDWVQAVGWVMVTAPIAAILLVGAFQMVRYGVPACFKPLPTWGPVEPENRTGRYASRLNVAVNGHSKSSADGGVENGGFVNGQEMVRL